MSTIDTRIVEMKFNNAQFLAGVKETLSSMQTLDKSLKMEGAGKGFSNLNASAQKVDLSRIASGVDSIQSKFSAMTVVAATALSNLTNKAVTAGLNITKALTISPITSGFKEYETGLNSVQTILANTQAAGTTLPQVNAALADLNKYADQTIYNFSDMTKNIGTFTAAGVDLKTAQGSIKGIANLAALSGSNTQQASTAMYQLSQAISSGRVSLQDWNSVTNAGMGGTVFQRALAQTAVKMGTLDKGAVTLKGSMKNVSIEGKSFRDSISAEGGGKSWLTSDVLTSTLKQLSGDMTDAQLKAQGFNAEQIKSIQAQAKMAKGAATQVKTLSQLYDTTKEAVGSGWASTFQLLLGDFGEAKALFTGINNVVSGIVGRSADARNKMLGDWKAMGGRTELLAGLKNLFTAFGSVIKPIKEAFREIFPATTAKQLFSMTKSFREFTEKLKMGGETAKNLKATFKGVFAIFGIGWEIIKKVVGVFAGLFKSASGGSGSFLKITAAIGNFLVKLHEAIKNGEGVKTFFDTLGTILGIPIKMFKALLGSVDGVGGALSKLGQAVRTAYSIIAKGQFKGGLWEEDSPIVNTLFKIREALGKAVDAVKKFWSGLTGGMKDGAGKLNFDAILGMLSVGFLAGIFMIFKTIKSKLLGPEGMGGIMDILKGSIGSITGPFDSLTGTLDEMQNTLKATTLLQLAIAIGILAASVVALSTVNGDDLKKALAAMGVAFGQLMLAMAIFQKINISSGMGQLILLALAIRILTSAVKELAKLNWEELAKGLIGTAVLLGVLAGAAHLMPDGKKMISSSLGIILMAVAVRILVGAVKDLSTMNWEELGKGLAGVGGILAALTLFTRFSGANKGGLLKGAGIILLAAGIKILASAVKDFAKMHWEDLSKGLAGVGGGLAIIAAALMLIPPTSVFSAAAVLVVAASLGLIADAMKDMGKMHWEDIGKGMTVLAGSLTLIGLALALIPPTSVLSAAAIFIVAGTLSTIGDALAKMGMMDWENIIKGLVALGGALAIIAIAMNAMTTAIFGATALVVVAGALAILAPILIAFGNMSWEEIVKGLLMLAGALTIIGLAGLLIGPVVPALIGLGLAIALIGAGVLLAGAGILALAAGLALLTAAGSGAIAVLLQLVAGLIAMIPSLGAALGMALIAFAQVIATSGPVIVAAFVTILRSMLKALRELIPEIATTISLLLTTILGLIRKHAPQIIDTFVAIARKFLAGVRSLLPDILATFTSIVMGILGVIRSLTPSVVATMLFLLQSLLNAVVGFVPKLVTAGMNIIIGFLNGIAAKIGEVVTAAVNIIVAFLTGISKNLPNIIQAGVDLILAFINGLATAIRQNSAAMGEAGGNLASAIIEGMVKGLGAGIGKVVQSAKNLAKSALDGAKSWLGINSPSKEFYKLGQWSAEGYALGMTGSSAQITAAAKTMQDLLNTARAAELKNIKSLEAKLKSLSRNRRKNAKAIRDTNKALAEARSEYAKTNAAIKVNSTFGDETAKLKAMANSIDTIDKKLVDARKKVEDATKARDDYNKTVKDQYANLPDVNADTKLTDYLDVLRKKVVDTQIFKAQLDKLRSLGLNDEMYKELVAKGTDAIPFVTQLLDRGAVGVKEINELDAALLKSSSDLGTSAAKALYQAGVDAAAGLVKGLENQKKNIEKQMDDIANYMVRSIKRALGIKSPSREFMKIGNWTVEGLAKGLRDSKPALDAADELGMATINAMRKSIADISTLASDSMDLQPNIRPVLDLSDIEKKAGGIGKMLSTDALNVSGAYSQAVNTARAMSSRPEDAQGSQTAEGNKSVSYVQNIYSPQALSNADIYRQTKSQISRVKEALNNS